MKPATISISSSNEQMPTTSEEWHVLDAVLRSYIRKYVYQSHLVHWQGGETELIDDVLQETFIRAINYTRKVYPSVSSFEAFCKTIAKHYLLDLHRKDKRSVLSIDNEWAFNASEGYFMSSDPTEAVEEEEEVYTLMLKFAQAIKNFPEKQRTAILIDLANLTDFDEKRPSPLERAMWVVGISLREYYCELPHDPVLRSRHTALVCLAYQKLRKNFASKKLDNVELPQQEQPGASTDEQSIASNIGEKTMDDAPEEDTNTALAEELSGIDHLHEPYKQAVQLHYVEKWTYPTIADYLKLPVGTVKSHVSRGLKFLHLLAQEQDIPMDSKVEQKRQEVLANLHKLEGLCKRAVQLHYLEGRSYPEVAAELQVPLNTAKSYIHRGMKLLCA